ncbi:MAG: hypothetical protein ACTSUE_00725 [Promethearchaeota archaeon]
MILQLNNAHVWIILAMVCLSAVAVGIVFLNQKISRKTRNIIGGILLITAFVLVIISFNMPIEGDWTQSPTLIVMMLGFLFCCYGALFVPYSKNRVRW